MIRGWRHEVRTSRVARSIKPIPGSSLATTSEHPLTPKRATVSRKNPPSAPSWTASESAAFCFILTPAPPAIPLPVHPLSPAGCHQKRGCLCVGGEQARVTFVAGPGEREKHDDARAEGGMQLRKSVTNTLAAVARSIVAPRGGQASPGTFRDRKGTT